MTDFITTLQLNPDTPLPKKVLMHIECLRGTGELTLASRIAEALADRGVEVVIASGNTRNFFHSDNPLIRTEKLPTVRYRDGTLNAYLTDRDTRLSEDTEWRQTRSEALGQLVAREKPDGVLLCYWPFGNGRDAQNQPILDEEMTALLKQLPRTTPVFGSIREVLHVDSKPAGGDPKEAVRIVNRHFTKLFVHGDPKFIPLTDDYDYSGHPLHNLRRKIDYTGYVCKDPATVTQAKKDTIIVTAGGGDYRPSSANLLKKVLLSLDKVDPAFLKGKEVRLFVGNSFDEAAYHDLKTLEHETGEKLKREGATVKLEHTLPLKDFQALLPHCALFVGQAGVGTMMDVLTYRYPAVVVPIEEKEASGGYNFKEQYVRARIFEKKGLIKLVKQHDLETGGDAGETLLAGHINQLFADGPRREAQEPVRCGGADYTADAICAAIGMGRQPRTRMPRNPVDRLAASR